MLVENSTKVNFRRFLLTLGGICVIVVDMYLISELYEGLSRAQRSRLEDQRGTEINFELPDFLKDKENNQSTCKPLRLSGEGETSKFYTNDFHHSKHIPLKSPKLDVAASYENTSILNNDLGGRRVLISPQTKINNVRINSPKRLSSDESSNQSTPSKSGSLNSTVVESAPTRNMNEPPPLPPKPKVLPMKPSNWGQNGYFKGPRDVLGNERSKQALFLEQPASSFV